MVRGMAPADSRPSSTPDIAIVGGGLVGSTLALALGQVGFGVALIDRETLATQTADAYDGRASAIALGSKHVLAGLGVWPRLAPAAGPILDIRVSDGPARSATRRSATSSRTAICGARWPTRWRPAQGSHAMPRLRSTRSSAHPWPRRWR